VWSRFAWTICAQALPKAEDHRTHNEREPGDISEEERLDR
jgi:hypothetical protein